jgi:predicted heme/steroid binding protein/uncharacterized membrane protein
MVMEEFEEKRLKEFDGKEDRAPYVAIDGKVFDLSSSDLWKNGIHMGQHNAGQDLSSAIAGAPHGKEVLERVVQVGVMKPLSTKATQPPPGWAVRFLKLHPHPISVHFPQALLTFAPLFLILFYLFENPHFERAGYYLLIAGWITSFPAFMTGILHWVYKHGKSKKGLYVFKLSMSVFLLIYGAIVIYIHSTQGVLASEPVQVPVLVLYLFLLPIIMSIGHAGGKIVFG